MSSNISNQALFQLKLVGFSDSDKTTFESILSLADNRLEKSWQITLAKDNVDFFVLSNRLRSQFDQDKLLQTLPREQCIFCALALSNDAEHELLVDKNNIPFLGPMAELFNKLSSHKSATKDTSELDVADTVPPTVSEVLQEPKPISLGGKPEVPEQMTIQPESLVNTHVPEVKTDVMRKSVSEPSLNLKSKSLGFFEKFTRSKKTGTESVSQKLPQPQHDEQAFVNSKKSISSIEDQNDIHLKDKQESHPPLSIENTAPADNIFVPTNHPFISRLLDNHTEQKLFFSLFNADQLYVDLQHKCYYSAHKLEGLQTYFTCQGKFFLQKMTDSQLQEVVSQQVLKPQPLNNLLWYAVFSCSQGNMIVDYQASDIVRLKRWPDINLPGSRELIKLAAYMHSNSVNLQMIQAETKFPMAVIRNFYNACKVIGLIELCQEKDVHEKTMDNDRRELYAKIGKRIKSIS
ncbi:MAG: hypothetical protein GQ581_00895 [Methyloprofundus sp.]|nr:hypothetical protein [Methyloprofundus sp.]